MGFLSRLFGDKDLPQKTQNQPSGATNASQNQNTQTALPPKAPNTLRKKPAEKIWINTLDNKSTEYFSLNFWKEQKIDLARGTFWADEIKELKDDPLGRLALALRKLPLPAAFTNAAVATRALIREKRKNKETYEKELSLLYWLAAINSFSIPYSEVLKEPGLNVLFSIPGKKISSLSFEYQKLGYERLDLLNKTDIKWMAEFWGSPSTHSTLHELYIDVWIQFETKLKSKREKETAKQQKYYENLMQG